MLYTLNILCLWAMVSIRRLLQCLWAMVSIRRLLQLSHSPFFLTGFHQTCCFTSNNLSTFFCSDLTDYQRNNAFSKYSKFFLPTYYWSVLISLFCVYVFLRALFHSSAIMKLQIVWCLHICIGCHSPLITSCCIRKEFIAMAWKMQAVIFLLYFIFFVSWGN